MVEIKNNYNFAGLILAVALIVGGVTYSLTPTGNYKVCDTGWKLQDNGKYDCNGRQYDCSSVRDTKTGRKGYYCDEATRIEIKNTVETQFVDKQCPLCESQSCPKVRVVKYDYDGSKWLCDDNGQNCVKFDELINNNFN